MARATRTISSPGGPSLVQRTCRPVALLRACSTMGSRISPDSSRAGRSPVRGAISTGPAPLPCAGGAAGASPPVASAPRRGLRPADHPPGRARSAEATPTARIDRPKGHFLLVGEAVTLSGLIFMAAPEEGDKILGDFMTSLSTT